MAKRMLLQGNDAVALGAVKAGLDFFAGYPITPASEILHKIVEFPRQVKVLQMEDEIASINACVGAALAGAKAMTATSGPGFSLMQEGIGLGHMVEAPLVVVNVQRVGPSTGMPTFGAQGDILQCRWGSHGDYFPIALYPNSVAELYACTIHAFNAAEESLSPVILLSDGYSFDLSGGNDERLGAKLRDAGIQVFVVHIAEEAPSTEVATIASMTGGQLFKAGDPAALNAVFQRIDEMKKSRIEKISAETQDDFRPWTMAGGSLAAMWLLSLFGLRYVPW